MKRKWRELYFFSNCLFGPSTREGINEKEIREEINGVPVF